MNIISHQILFIKIQFFQFINLEVQIINLLFDLKIFPGIMRLKLDLLLK